MKTLYAVVIVAIVAGCASIQPAPVQVGDRCINCRRTIGNLQVAAEVVDQLKTPLPFRTAGCLAKYLKGHPDQTVAAVFVTDYKSGRMLLADDAWFVPTTMTPVDGTRAEPDFLAFRARSDATAASNGKPVLLRWAQVVAQANAN
jgi:hypothetical protein